MTDTQYAGSSDWIGQALQKLMTLITGGGPPPSGGLPSRVLPNAPTGGGNGLDFLRGLASDSSPIPPSRPDMVGGDPSLVAVQKLIEDVKSEISAGGAPSGSRAPGSARGVKPPRPEAGTKSVPVPVAPAPSRFGGGYTDAAQAREAAPSIDIAQTAPAVNPLNAGRFSGGYTAAQTGAPPPPAVDPAAVAQYLFTPPPANFAPSAPPVGGPAAPPTIPMGTGPNQGGGRAVASGGSYGSPEPSAGVPPTASAYAAAPPPDPTPYLPPGATFGPQFAQGIDPRVLMALAGLTRGRQ